MNFKGKNPQVWQIWKGSHGAKRTSRKKDYLLDWKKEEVLSRVHVEPAAAGKGDNTPGLSYPERALTSMCAFSARSRQHLVVQEVGLVVVTKEALLERKESKALGR